MHRSAPAVLFFFDVAGILKVFPAGNNQIDQLLIHVIVNLKSDGENKKLSFVTITFYKGGVGHKTKADHIADSVGTLQHLCALTAVINNILKIIGLFLAFLFSLVILLVDILYAFIDPRIKAKYQNGGRSRE